LYNADIICKRYTLNERLGQGRATTTYKAYDHTLEKTVALKILQTSEKDELESFKKEFKLLAQISYPHILLAFDFGYTKDGLAFFTSEFIEGKDLKLYTQQYGEDNFIPLLKHLLETLDFLHLKKITHGDLKPSHILIQQDANSQPTLKLIDLGFATIGKQHDFSNWKGTLGYIAPEILRGEEFDHRADLYSLGVLLYEILTGKLPFSESDEISRSKSQLEEELILDDIASLKIPLQSLGSAIRKLQKRNPEERFQSAFEVMQEFEKISSSPTKEFRLKTPIYLLTSSRVTGHETAISSFEQIYSETTSEKKGKFVLITGETGVGKSRALQQCEVFAQLESGIIVKLRTSPTQEHKDALFQSILRQLQTISNDIAPELLKKFSVLIDSSFLLETGKTDLDRNKKARAVPSPPIDSITFSKTLADFIIDLGQVVEKPLLFSIDDLCNVNIGELGFLEYLSFRLPEGKIIILAGLTINLSQSDKDKKARRAEEWLIKTFDINLVKIELKPLSRDKCIEFLKDIFNFSDGNSVLETIYAKTGGNVLLIKHFFELLCDKEAIIRTQFSWEIDKKVLDNFALPDIFVSEIEDRLTRLTFEGLNLLSPAAVLGREFETKVLLEMLHNSKDDLYVTLNEIILEGLLRFEKSGKVEKLCFPNGLIRDYIYRKIEPLKREEIHKKAGDIIREIYKDRTELVVEELAHHYVYGKDLELGFKYSILAAQKAEKECQYQTAIDFYLQGLEFYRESFGKFLKLKEEILERLGTLYELAGDPQQGLDYLKRAYKVLSEKKGSVKYLSQISEKIGNIYVRLGKFDEAISNFEEGLKLIAHTDSVLEKTELLNALGSAYHRKQEFSKALDNLNQSIEILEQKKLEVVQLADAYRLTGVVHWIEGAYEDSFSCYSKSAEVYRKVKDRKGEGMVLNNLGILYQNKGEPEKALEYFNQAHAIPEIHNDSTLLSSLYTNLTVSYIELCEWEKAEKVGKENLSLREKLSSQEGIALASNNLGFIYSQKGLLDDSYSYHQKAKLIFERLNLRLGVAKSQYLQAIVHYHRGESDQRIRLLEEAIPVQREHSNRPGLADSLMLLAKIQLEKNEISPSESLFREALSLYEEQKHTYGIAESLIWLTQILLVQNKFTEAEAYLLQIDRLLTDKRNPYLQALARQNKGLYFHQTGLSKNALEELLESSRIFRKCQMKYELANTYVLISEIKQEQRLLKEAKQYLKQALIIYRDLKNEKMTQAVETFIKHSVDTEALESDRLKTLYKFSALINEVFDSDELLLKALDMAVSFLAAERGAIILLNPVTRDLELKVAREMESETQEDALRISKQVVAEVTKTEEPLIIEDAQLDSRVNRNLSVVMYNILSILCVPLKIRDQVVGTIYLDHRSLPNVFSKEDLEFMKTFGNLISTVLEKSQLHQRLSEELYQLKGEITVKYNYSEMLGKDEKMQEIFHLIERVANSKTSVLLLGESGTGKELIANLIHKRSSRLDRPFVKVNCAALPESLLESELFGIEEKVATGVTSRKGKFEQAHAGTIFLDEVGDMTLSTQAKVLRVLQEREFERVGGSQTIQVDIRVIAATNMDLEEKIESKTFRKDLYYRLNPVTIKLPPLRKRKEDIPFLVDYFLEKFSKENAKPKLKITSDVMTAFLDYPWPGNIRELSNVIEQGVLLSEENTFTRKSLPLYLKTGREFAKFTAGGKLDEIISSVERQIVLSALESSLWNQSKAAKKLGLPESSLRRKIAKLKIERPLKI